ncbi:MAG: DUF2723 domain-containing protein [Sandaracinaceae bacterium]|nr:DUF2723 domain-containing protein [Sandaracinaceae bacterium]
MKALALPLARPRDAAAASAIVFALYAATGAWDLTFYDSPELALVAVQLGIGHPIGMPLHTLIGFLFAHIPGVPAPAGLMLMSALFGALCVVPCMSIAERIAGPSARSSLWIAAVLVLLCAQRVAWEPATRIEVYTLANFLALYAVASAARAQDDRAHPLWPAALALGLAASTHAVIAAAHALALIPLVVLGRPPLRALGKAALALAAGLLPFATLPLAARPEVFAWGAPRDLASLAAYLSGRDYAHNQGIDAPALLAHAGELALHWLAQGMLPIALAAIACAIGIAGKGLRWHAAIAALILGGFVSANVVFHVEVPDYLGDRASPFLAAGAALAGGVARLAARGDRFRLYAGAALIPLLAPLALSQHLVPRDARLARALAEGALAEAPRGAIIIAESDHWVAPLLFVQEAEGLRPDVVIVARGLSSSSWYWEHLYARHPDLAPVELRGPGGRDGRLARLAAASPERAVLVESVEHALRLGRRPCGVGLLVWTGESCTPPADPASDALDALAPREGEPLEVIARVGLTRGEALWRIGDSPAALRALLAGLGPRFARPPITLPIEGPPLAGPLPSWSRSAALHDPARNIAIAGLLLHSAGHADEARAYLELARRDGLPEASAFLQATAGD